jgi:adenosylcobinamide amidohydrolase
MHVVASTPAYIARRGGRHFTVELKSPHRVLSTCAVNGGIREDVRWLVNYQSCEGAAHAARAAHLKMVGPAGAQREVCEELGLPLDSAAVMGTAANVQYTSLACEQFQEFEVTVFATAGVYGNAAMAGDPALWLETPQGWKRVEEPAGTINLIVLTSVPLTPGALARAAITVTEGKSAALARLCVPSRYSSELATGTGTDQLCIAAPIDENQQQFTGTGPHSKLGELLGISSRNAVLEALRWQNGLEPSYTRSLVHALGRFGLTDQVLKERVSALLNDADAALLAANWMAVIHEPLASAHAYAAAAVLDRLRHGTLSGDVAEEAVRRQAAGLASAMAARVDLWSEFYSLLDSAAPEQMLVRAIALGWERKWK